MTGSQPRSRPRPIRRTALAGVFFGACIAAILAIGGGASADAPVCPENTGGDTGGKVLVRLVSGLAFWFDGSGYMLRGSPLPSDDPNLPPEGCPGNPIITRGISFPYRYNALLEDRRAPRFPEGRPDLLQIFGHDGPVNIQRGDLKLFDHFKAEGAECEVLSDVLEVCRIVSRSLPRRRWNALYRALPGAYFEHEGLPFAGKCIRSGGGDELGSRICEFDYMLMDGLSVCYRIDDRKIPEDQFIAFDRELRRQILAARAPEHDVRPATGGAAE